MPQDNIIKPEKCNLERLLTQALCECLFLIFCNPIPKAKKNLVFSLSSTWFVSFILLLFLLGHVLIDLFRRCLCVGELELMARPEPGGASGLGAGVGGNTEAWFGLYGEQGPAAPLCSKCSDVIPRSLAALVSFQIEFSLTADGS